VRQAAVHFVLRRQVDALLARGQFTLLAERT